MLSQILLISTIIGTVHVHSVDCTHEVLKARTYIFEAVKGGNPKNVIGVIDLTQSGTLVKLNGTVSGLKPGLHGFHIHEKGDLGDGCVAAAGHFNPHKMMHGAPDDSNRHVGDLGNIETPLNGTVSGLKPGLHGFHIHEKGDLGDGCVAAAGHFNPHKMMHGAPDDSNRHVGDLGNIETPKSGDTTILLSDSVISLNGQHNVIGRAIVIHADVDDLGRGTSELSKTTGNAGARVACGVIGILEEVDVIPTPAPLSSVNLTTEQNLLIIIQGQKGNGKNSLEDHPFSFDQD
ncbi:copper/zinc superoxide dismutase [Teladorsagia circumcincta]|uniref:Superoxide dismutase [Cu-Zn] n=1 Tax=Teladorsagia circumcincta TaxID=45464 RepID=A0A2G9V0W2_TELCI|nr:copper/zinc superoxide dismutase [Teladorsagia circumcincta]